MTKNRKNGKQKDAALQFSRVNLILAAAALATISLGYFLLANGSISAAPLLLVLGYVVLVPLAIIL
ncbi:MAG: hypothetical protein BMS9Abin29_2474 [Gemmatimonadota bacterium]|nr:MAG: hypothetical protein BMS9Abin29_2474 [Gemmatimonadota bacterium]